jgi:hypothetical protein
LTYLSILDENFTEEQAINLPNKNLLLIFRTTSVCSWSQLTTEYMKSQEEHVFLKLFIDKIEEISLLSNLHPIIEFTNFMMNLLNLKISRQEAKEKKISDYIDLDDSVHIKLWENFRKAWSNISYHSTQYACKVLPRLTEMTLDLPVSFILPDDRELGYGMYMAAAFQFLGQIQNEVLESAIYLIKSDSDYSSWSHMDNHRYNIQKISPQEIIMYQTDLSDIQSYKENYAKFYDVYNFKFRTSMLNFNFEKIENELAMKLLLNKKILNYEELSKIQYKFELLSTQGKNSNLINDLKGKFKQVEIREEDKCKIKECLEKMEKINSANSLSNDENIFNPHLYEIKINQIIFLYQIVEAMLFKYVKDYISRDYNKIIIDEVKNKIFEFLQKTEISTAISNSRYPSVKNLINVVQRFIIRCLVAFIEPSFPLKDYLMRNDFWDLEITEEMSDNFYYDFPDDLLVENSVALLECFIEYEKIKESNLSKVEDRSDSEKLFFSKKKSMKNI